MQRLAVVSSLLLPAVLLLAAGVSRADAADLPERPNIVFVLTDDQRWDTMWAMPLTLDLIARDGVTFSHAVVTTPVCGPTRASIVTGGYLAQNTGVITNGAFGEFRDRDTLPLQLQRSGYVTGMVGKYVNGYDGAVVPRGWTYFAAGGGRSFYVGSSGEDQGVTTRVVTGQHPAYGVRDEALAFLASHLPSADPVFLFVNFVEPHRPAIPAPGDEDLYADFVYRERAYQPGFVYTWFDTVAEQDEFVRDQLRSLQAVDRSVAALYEAVEAAGELDDTVFVFSSDNGFLWGEHGAFAKKSPYDESIRVPLLVKVPGVPERVEDRLVAMNLDVPALILELAGVPYQGDGRSLGPLLADPLADWPEDVFLEQWDRRWAAVQVRDATGSWKYVDGWIGKLLFDLDADPFEESNLAGDPAYAAIEDRLGALVEARQAVGPLWYKARAPSAAYGQPYSWTPGAVGGDPPYAWSVDPAFPLPLGLALEGSHITGVLWEVPRAPVTIRYTITSQTPRTQARGHQRYTGTVTLEADPRTDYDGDGWLDVADNCPGTPNPDQLDTRGSGIGDACSLYSQVRSCGLGAELVAVLAALIAAARARRPRPPRA